MQPISNWYEYSQYREQKAIEQAQNAGNQHKKRWITNMISRITHVVKQSTNHDTDRSDVPAVTSFTSKQNL